MDYLPSRCQRENAQRGAGRGTFLTVTGLQILIFSPITEKSSEEIGQKLIVPLEHIMRIDHIPERIEYFTKGENY